MTVCHMHDVFDYIRRLPTGIVSNVEYLGSTVKLVANGAGIDDFTVILDDTEFFAAPVKVGDAIPLSWEAPDAIVLGRLEH